LANIPKGFKRRHDSFFKQGLVGFVSTVCVPLPDSEQVFQCLYNEEAGPALDNPTVTDFRTTTNGFGQSVYAEVRMFVILQDNQNHSSTCL
jgi:hypothetical protein